MPNFAWVWVSDVKRSCRGCHLKTFSTLADALGACGASMLEPVAVSDMCNVCRSMKWCRCLRDRCDEQKKRDVQLP